MREVRRGVRRIVARNLEAFRTRRIFLDRWFGPARALPDKRSQGAQRGRQRTDSRDTDAAEGSREKTIPFIRLDERTLESPAGE